MGLEVLTVTADSPQHHLRRFRADGAVSRCADCFCCLFQQCQILHRGFGIHVQDPVNNNLQLAQSYPAWCTLAAALRMTQPQKRCSQIHRTLSRRTGDDTAFQVLIQAFHRLLNRIFRFDKKSVHVVPPCQQILPAFPLILLHHTI